MSKHLPLLSRLTGSPMHTGSILDFPTHLLFCFFIPSSRRQQAKHHETSRSSGASDLTSLANCQPPGPGHSRCSNVRSVRTAQKNICEQDNRFRCNRFSGTLQHPSAIERNVLNGERSNSLTARSTCLKHFRGQPRIGLL